MTRVAITIATLAAALLAVPLSAADSKWAATQPSNAAHWSFVKPERPVEPFVKNAAWCRNPIDEFVLAKLEKEGVVPAPQAPPETLLRRVSLDLTGLPPSPGEVGEFLADLRPDAYERAVDRLLASPHYGERWGKHWLDAARYADSNGYSIDAARQMWKYRDWVINATNRDVPFDEFVIEQLAGDLLHNPTIDQTIATGFHRNTQINEEGGIDKEQFRVESIIDRVNTTGTVFLGLTIGCAQCHDHKFDPISQKDYYRFYSFFNNCDEPVLKLPTPQDLRRQETIRPKIEALEEEKKQADPASSEKNLNKKIAALKKELASDGTSTLVIKERAQPRETHVFTKGDFTRPAELVTPAVPAVLPQISMPNPNRLDLAKWITSQDNPLTARVSVNRIWQEYFGLGLVNTENDFGTQGSLPTHPELLDWLATEFFRQHWSRKAIHRLIVTSATYRQSSNVRPELTTSDPYNHLLARQTRLRLDAEIVRDVGLAASGLLTETVGGPSVFPPQPEGVMGLAQVKREWKTSTGPDRYRRGMYTFLWRANPHPLLTAFDATNATASCTRRLRSNTPLQALILLNDDAEVEFAQVMAARILGEARGDSGRQIDYAFRLCASRLPDPDERKLLIQLLDNEKAAYAAAPKEAEALVTKGHEPGSDAGTLAAWTIVSRVLLNLDETITRE